MVNVDSGWIKLYSSLKFHYFDIEEKRSLCRYYFTPRDNSCIIIKQTPNTDEVCKNCLKRFLQIKKRQLKRGSNGNDSF